MIAFDGKTLRGTIPTADSHGVHLLAAYVPDTGVVLVALASITLSEVTGRSRMAFTTPIG